jgi:hypothetical protein
MAALRLLCKIKHFRLQDVDIISFCDRKKQFETLNEKGLKKTVNQLSEIIKAKDPSSCHYSFILIHGAGSFVSSPSQLTLIIVLT